MDVHVGDLVGTRSVTSSSSLHQCDVTARRSHGICDVIVISMER